LIITGCCSRENSLGGAFDDISGYSDGRTGSNAKQQAALAKYGPFANWDISQVTNMKYALASINQYEVRNRYYTPVYSEYSGYTSTFNGDLSKWDVSRVTDMTNSKYSNIHNSFK
jgi:surface protein